MDGPGSSGSVTELPEVEQPAKLSSATARQIILVIVPPALFSVDESIGASGISKHPKGALSQREFFWAFDDS